MSQNPAPAEAQAQTASAPPVPAPTLEGGPVAPGSSFADQVSKYHQNRGKPAAPSEPAAPAIDPAAAAAQAPSTPTPAAPVATPPVQRQEEPVFLGNRRFNSQAELIAHLQERDARLAQIESTVSPPPAPQSLEMPLEDMIFTDTKGAVQKIREQVKQELRQESDTEKRAKQVREDFFKSNPDLNNPSAERMIGRFAADMAQELAKLPEADALSKLAQTVRAEIASIKGAQAATEQLSSRPATTVGSTSGQPIATGNKAGPATDFISQMNMMKTRGKTRY